MENPERFEVFFDGQCPLCRREIEMIRRKDRKHQLILTDIAEPDFKSDEHALETLMSEIHGRQADGTYVKGVEVFREIYDRLGYGRLVSATRFPIVRNVLNFFYQVFAKLRFWHAMHRMKKTRKKESVDCVDGKCQMEPIPSRSRPLKPLGKTSARS